MVTNICTSTQMCEVGVHSIVLVFRAALRREDITPRSSGTRQVYSSMSRSTVRQGFIKKKHQ